MVLKKSYFDNCKQSWKCKSEIWKLMLDLPRLLVLSPGHVAPVPKFKVISFLDWEHTHAQWP